MTTPETETLVSLANDVTRSVAKLLRYQGVPDSEARDYARLVATATVNWGRTKFGNG